MNIDLDNPFNGVTECAIHLHAMEEGCEFCETEFEGKNEVSAVITEKVSEGFRELVRDGVRPPDGLVSNIRLELLIESCLTDRNRLHFEVEVGRRLWHSLQETKKDLTRQKIAGKEKTLTVVQR